MIVTLVLDALTGVSVIGPLPLAETPERVPTTVDVQLNTVPAIDEVGRKLSVVPLQISWINEVDEFVMTGLGLTVTTTSTKLPGHPFAVGTIRYVTVPGLVPSVDVSTWLIVAPDPATAPDTFVDVSTVHVNVVPDIPLGFVIATFVLVPEHIVSGEAAASGIGLTVTLTAYGDPTHPAADGRII